MTPDAVYEVGNTRIKCGRVIGDGTISTRIFDTHVFDMELTIHERSIVTVAGSNPDEMSRLVQWLRGNNTDVTEVTSCTQLPLTITVDAPETVGLDRLLGAVAANRRRTPGRAAITVDVGTAATVNFVDSGGIFRGGMILPGPTTMAKSLHAATAKLPLLDDAALSSDATFPAHPTVKAMSAGIAFAIAGAVTLAMQQSTVHGVAPQLFLTGGGYGVIAPLLRQFKPVKAPTLNLEGLFITAESLP